MAMRSEHSEAKVFCGGLSPDTTEDSLHAYFVQFGDIKDHVVMKNQHGQSRCFGFVTFNDLFVAQEVVTQKHHDIDGKTCDCKLAVPGSKQLGGDTTAGQPIKAKKIFIGGLHQDATTDILKEYFAQFGEIEDVISMNDGEQKRGFGYVTFVLQDAVEKVLEDPKSHDICGKLVECKRCVPKEATERGQREAKGFGKAGKGKPAYQPMPYQPYQPPPGRPAPAYGGGYGAGGAYTGGYGGGYGGYASSYGPPSNQGYGATRDYQGGYSGGYGGR